MSRVKIELPETAIASFKIPVRITDINYGNHLGNDSLVSIIHEARVQFLQLYGFTELNVSGTSLIMNELIVEFKNEAFYQDVLETKIFIGEISKVSFEIYYSLSTYRNDKAIVVANAKTGMVCFDYAEKKVRHIPEKLRELLAM
ncbi:MAG: thioesterase family protein [Bacteroidota bacterium]|nr:thioesterase family protein [Bacteroidota bacterium]